GLYTVDAWKLFLQRLTPTGVVSFSRWYQRNLPAETYRLATLAAEALRQSGIEDPRGHILLAALNKPFPAAGGVATIMVSREKFSAADVERFRDVTAKMKFDVLLTPLDAPDATLAGLVDPATSAAVLASS